MGVQVAAASIYGLIGAVVGGGLTLIGSWLNVRIQRLQAIGGRSHQLGDRMIAAHSEFLTKADVFFDRMKALEEAQCAADGDLMKSLRLACKEAWIDFVKARGPAAIAGPEGLVGLMNELHDALLQYAKDVDEWRPSIPKQERPDCKAAAHARAQEMKVDKKFRAYECEAQRQFFGSVRAFRWEAVRGL